MLNRTLIFVAMMAVVSVGCGDDANTNNGGANNGGANNGGANNGSSNNGGANNGGANNGAMTMCSPAFGESDACGGDPVGTWSIAEACTDFDYEGAIRQLCPTATVNGVEENVSGSLDVTDTNFEQSSSGTISVDAIIPNVCAAAAGGCSGVEQTAQNINATADCSQDANGGCACIVDFGGETSTSGTYTVDGGVATVNSEETWLFCVENGEMTLRRTDSDQTEHQLVYVLTQ